MNDSNRHPDNNRPRRAPSGAGSDGLSDGRLVEVHSQLAREKEEPAAGFSLTPIFVVFLFCGFGFWAGLYLTRNSGNFAPSAFDLDAPKLPAGGEVFVFEPSAEKGQVLFNANCAACHQPTGLGVAGMFPPLAGSPWVAGNGDRMLKVILAGMVGEIEVKGAKYNNPAGMLAIGAGLKDGQIAHIATYVRQAWGNNAEPVMDTKVAEVRKAIAGHKAPYSPPELLKEHPLGTK